MTLTSDSQKLLELLRGGQKLTALVAPSFPVDFIEEQIVYGLNSLGFDKVVDLSLAIATVNKTYEELFIKNVTNKCHPELVSGSQSYNGKMLKQVQHDTLNLIIVANCPATVNLVKTKFPELSKFLGPVFSPMVCMGKVCREKYPSNLNIFIGPCLAKKDEAKSYPQEIAVALTYKEIIDVFESKGIDYKNPPNSGFKFESFHSNFLHLFPAPGGVKATIKKGLLMDAEVIIADGSKEVTEVLTALQQKKLSAKIRFLDIVFCEGGCIGGPGIKSDEPLACRKARFLLYRNNKKDLPLCSEADVKSAIDPNKCPIKIVSS